MNIKVSLILFWILLGMQISSSKAQNQGIDLDDIDQSIHGALLFLADRQIKDLPGQESCMFDFAQGLTGCKNHSFLQLPHFPKIKTPNKRDNQAKNIPGIWASEIHLLPNLLGHKGRSISIKPDFNLFVPLSIAYSLLQYDDSHLTPENQLVRSMIQKMWDTPKAYNRGKAYNFWLPLSDNPDYQGPSTISLEILDGITKHLNNDFSIKVRNWVMKKQYVPSTSWMKQILDRKQNSTGTNAIFNVPNDSDDTALALWFQNKRMELAGRYPDQAFFQETRHFTFNQAALEQLLRYRDIGRKPEKEDGRDGWRGRNSHAYLTWLKDENTATFQTPESGIIPFGQNNVDGVVNANVLFCLSQLDFPLDSLQPVICLIDQAIQQQSWPECGLYYPQMMLFPYAASRAYREGSIQTLKPAMKVLLRQILDLGKVYYYLDHRKKGAFPGGEDLTDHLSTGLALCALLNIGSELAEEEQCLEEYNLAIEKGIKYLLKHRKKTKILFPEYLPTDWLNEFRYAYSWKPGIYFSSSFWDIAHWRSEAFTTAIILEAFIKYKNSPQPPGHPPTRPLAY